MPYYPIFMNIEGKPVLVVGGGTVAARKVRALLKAGADVSLVAKGLADELKARVDCGEVRWLSERFDRGLVEGYWLAFAATDDRSVNQAVYQAGEAKGVPVNVVDDTALCRFISPAVVDRDPVMVAVSTGGESPLLARAIRRWIEELLPRGLGKIAIVAGRVRRRMRSGMTLAERRKRFAFLFDRAKLVSWSNESRAIIARRMNATISRAGSEPIGGKVFLVGAGPGRAELLTLRALEVLQQADVVLHDRLVPQEILETARKDADFVDVGKRAGRHKGVQARIFSLMLEYARAGKIVVRLKGGDAFVFGRGGEELQHLKAHGIGYEVVPGITAALGCAAYAGIPLTHRDHAQSLTLTTGHLAGADENTLVVPRGAQGHGNRQTLVLYMGVGQAARIRERLLAQGMASDTPVALVVDGTLDSQRVLYGDLSVLPALAAQVPEASPGLFIIGNVAALGESLAWFGRKQAFERAA